MLRGLRLRAWPGPGGRGTGRHAVRPVPDALGRTEPRFRAGREVHGGVQGHDAGPVLGRPVPPGRHHAPAAGHGRVARTGRPVEPPDGGSGADMTRANVEAQFARMRELASRSEPLSPEEKAEYDSQRAREMAKAEARRQPSPQLDLEQAA